MFKQVIPHKIYDSVSFFSFFLAVIFIWTSFAD